METNWLNTLQQHRAIAVLRPPQLELGLKLASTLIEGGMHLIEITWNSDRPVQLIQTLTQKYPHCCIGAGTLLNEVELQEAIAAGAQFLFCPHVNPHLIQKARAAGLPIIPGALTPTEIVTAWQEGAPCVKVFPIQAVGGVTYIKNLQAPLGQIPLIPTGGITLENAKDFIEAGAIAVGLSSQLFPPDLIKAEAWEAIAQRCHHLHLSLQPTINFRKF